MELNKAKEFINFQMVINMKENLLMIIEMVMAL